MPTNLFLVFCSFFLFSATCFQKKDSAKVVFSATAPPDTLPYFLAQPNHTIFLESEDLKEISGLSPTDQPGVFLANNDEKGTIFFVDGNAGGGILNRVNFKDKGDFEDLAMVGDTIYVVKSSGKIFQVFDWKKDKPGVVEFDTPLKKEDDVEGLGFDKKKNVLLLACKGNTDSATVRRVFSFDLKTKKLGENPTYTIDPQQVNELLEKDGEDDPKFFSPSGIAVHPLRPEVYVISSVGKTMAVLDYNSGQLRYLVKLDKSILPQPEGIAFDASGNLFLSSEGKKGEGMLLRFDFHR